MNILDIKRLREEAERDLDALRRVEAMLRRQRNGHGTSGEAVPGAIPAEAAKSGQAGEYGNVGVKARVGEIIRNAGNSGLRPKDVTDVIEKEFRFPARANAAAAVSSALARFGEKGQVRKRENGRYFWVE